jgi:glutamyl-tRNA synthetase
MADTIVVNVLGEPPVKTQLPAEIRDAIVRRRDALPAYQLCSVVDDLYFGIDLVVRGEDLWPSTLLQIYLAGLLEPNAFQTISFYHHPLLSDQKGEKLSKSAGATSIHYLRSKGISAEDVYAQMGAQLSIKAPVKHWKDLISFI